MQEILQVKANSQAKAKSGKNAAKGDAGLFKSELENASATSAKENSLQAHKALKASGETRAPTEASGENILSGKLNATKAQVLNANLSTLALVNAAKSSKIKTIASNVKKPDSLDLSKALNISSDSPKSKLQEALLKLDEMINKVLIKLDKKIKQGSEQIAQKPNLLKEIITEGFDVKSKIKHILQDAKDLNKVLPKRLQISKEELLESIKIQLSKNKSYGKELLDDLSFTKMLDLAQSLKAGAKLPDLSTLFKLDLSPDASLKIGSLAKDASSVKELINSLKDKLNINKLTFEKINNEEYCPEIFADKFPKLYEDNFFATALSLRAQKSKPEPLKLAKKALNIEELDLKSLQSGKLNELLNQSIKSTEQIKQKLDALKDVKEPVSSLINTEQSEHKNGPKLNENAEHKDNVLLKSDLKTAFVSGQHLNKAQSKAVIENFAQDFKDELAKFKAPMHKVSIALKPAELGEINVTMMARGHNLQVNLQTANTNTMNIFVQNQAEIRTALVNMGFTGLSMNFSSNGEGSKQQHSDQSRKNSREREEADENTKIEPSGINFTLERYL